MAKFSIDVPDNYVPHLYRSIVKLSKRLGKADLAAEYKAKAEEADNALAAAHRSRLVTKVAEKCEVSEEAVLAVLNSKVGPKRNSKEAEIRVVLASAQR